MKKIPTILWLNLIIWSLAAYYIINKWNMITKNTFWAMTFLIGTLSVIEIIWLIVWGIRNQNYKTKLFILIVASITMNILTTFTSISDWILARADLYLHSQDRLEIVELTLKEEKNLSLNGKYEYLSVCGNTSQYLFYGCPVVLFPGYHGIHGFFDYGNNGYLVYVSDEENFDAENFCKYIGSFKMEISKINDHWYFAIESIRSHK